MGLLWIRMSLSHIPGGDTRFGQKFVSVSANSIATAASALCIIVFPPPMIDDTRVVNKLARRIISILFEIVLFLNRPGLVACTIKGFIKKYPI
jgi:hypothetical protein